VNPASGGEKCRQNMKMGAKSAFKTTKWGQKAPPHRNIMLNELDKEMEKRGLNFVRYADDCIIMVGSEMSANRVMRNISRFIEEKLGLKVNMTKSKVDRPQERCFPQGKIHSARQCQSCMQAGRSFHARLFPRHSTMSDGLQIPGEQGTAGECQSRSRRPFWCSRCTRRNTRYTTSRRNGRQQKR